MKSLTRLAVVAAVVPAVAGCGLFKSSGSSEKYKANDPNRTVARAVASVSNTTSFNDADPGNAAVFHATLYDDKGNQFFGPSVTLDSAEVKIASDADTSTIYEQKALTIAPGQTYSTVIQGHGVTSPPATPPISITSPTRAKDKDGNNLGYYEQPTNQPATITWTGGDPSQPVYIVVAGTFGSSNYRRVNVEDDPQKSPTDPENFGKPIANTGSYTIPAQLTERYLQPNGSVATRTINVFANTQTPNSTDASLPKAYTYIYVVQRNVTLAPPVSFSMVIAAKATAAMSPSQSH